MICHLLWQWQRLSKVDRKDALHEEKLEGDKLKSKIIDKSENISIAENNMKFHLIYSCRPHPQ